MIVRMKKNLRRRRDKKQGVLSRLPSWLWPALVGVFLVVNLIGLVNLINLITVVALGGVVCWWIKKRRKAAKAPVEENEDKDDKKYQEQLRVFRLKRRMRRAAKVVIITMIVTLALVPVFAIIGKVTSASAIEAFGGAKKLAKLSQAKLEKPYFRYINLKFSGTRLIILKIIFAYCNLICMPLLGRMARFHWGVRATVWFTIALGTGIILIIGSVGIFIKAHFDLKRKPKPKPSEAEVKETFKKVSEKTLAEELGIEDPIDKLAQAADKLEEAATAINPKAKKKAKRKKKVVVKALQEQERRERALRRMKDL